MDRRSENEFDFGVDGGVLKIRASVNSSGLRALLEMMPILRTLVYEGEKDCIERAAEAKEK